MFDWPILDVSLGLIFVYLVLGLIGTAVQETIASFGRLRAKNLKEGISTLLADPQLAERLYRHPLIKGLHRREMPPSYVPTRAFVAALLDEVRDQRAGADLFEQIKAGIAAIKDSDVGKVLALMLAEAERTGTAPLDRLQANAAAWFDNGMERVAGWYRRQAQWLALAIAASLTVIINVDSIEVAKALWREPAVRQVVAAQAQRFYELRQPDAAGSGRTTAAPLSIEKLRGELQPLPVGWPQWFARWQPPAARAEAVSTPPEAASESRSLLLLQTLAGWSVTAFAASLGAPFWFDLLGKVLTVRGTVKPEQHPAAGR